MPLYPPQTLTASNGQPPYTWTLAGGALPPKLSLSADGVISGKAKTAGTFNFTVQVTDGAAATATRNLAITVKTGSLFPGYYGPCGVCH